MEGAMGPFSDCSFPKPRNHGGSVDYSSAARIALKLQKMIAARDRPPNLLLNVNIPYLCRRGKSRDGG